MIFHSELLVYQRANPPFFTQRFLRREAQRGAPATQEALLGTQEGAAVHMAHHLAPALEKGSAKLCVLIYSYDMS